METYLPPARIWMAIVTSLSMALPPSIPAQHLGSARAVGIGAATAFARDLYALDWNPAGLVNMRDWTLSATDYLSSSGPSNSFSFQSAGVGRRFSIDHAAALSVSPGTSIEFVVPSTLSIPDSTRSGVIQFDQKISYNERYSLGYAFRPHADIALGLSLHFLEEKVSETKYAVDSNFIIRPSIIEFTGNSWTIDWGVIWESDGMPLRIGLVAKNLFRITERTLDPQVAHYSFKTPKILRLGMGFTGFRNFTLGIDGDTERRLRVGGEWSATEDLCVRSGFYLDAGRSSQIADAIAFGIGTSYQSLALDLSYLKFVSQEDRRGVANLETFRQSDINGIEYNRFTRDRVTVSATLYLGRAKEALARIEYVEMLSEVFPASQMVYAFRPLGKARVRNVSSKPIEAKVSFFVNKLMDAPTQSKPLTISPGEVAEIPFFAVFNDAIQAVRSLVVRDGDVYVQASTQEDFDDRYQARILVRGKNDWNGDVMLLRYFMTPQDPDVVAFTRHALATYKSHLDTLSVSRQHFEKARIVFNELASRLLYVNDPKQSQDFVQYPAETLSLRGGDCDDMTVCYATLLSSMGIATALVDVVPPDRPDNSHIYLLFDTGITPENASIISDNPKRFVIRPNDRGNETVWIPIETTVTRSGFEEAWTVGSREYFNDVELRLGAVQGWVRIVDVQVFQ
jgi:hypothetical protein